MGLMINSSGVPVAAGSIEQHDSSDASHFAQIRPTRKGFVETSFRLSPSSSPLPTGVRADSRSYMSEISAQLKEAANAPPTTLKVLRLAQGRI